MSETPEIINISPEKVTSAKSFFKGMPENGIAVHAGLSKYSDIKKGPAGLSYDSAYYYYIPKPLDNASDQDSVMAYESAQQGIRSTTMYAEGATSKEYGDRFDELIRQNRDQSDPEFKPKEIYKNHPELLPTIMFYEAPKDLAGKYKIKSIGIPNEVPARESPIPSENFLFEIKMDYKEISRLGYKSEISYALVDKANKRIEKDGWIKDVNKKDPINKVKEMISGWRKKDVSNDSLDETLNDLIKRDPNDKMYKEAVTSLKESGLVDMDKYLIVYKAFVDAGIMSIGDLRSSKNPIGVYELFRRSDQIQRILQNDGIDAAKAKVKRILGSTEVPLLKRENIAIKSLLVAAKLKMKYGDSVNGVIVYGSQVDKYKPVSDEVDFRVIITPPVYDVPPYNIEFSIKDDVEKMVEETMGKECTPTFIYSNDIDNALNDDQLKSTLLLKNKAIDARSIPIIFNIKDRQKFKRVFSKNLSGIQVESGMRR